MILLTTLFGKQAMNNVIVNGIVLAEDRRKMSKSLKNCSDPTLWLMSVELMPWECTAWSFASGACQGTKVQRSRCVGCYQGNVLALSRCLSILLAELGTMGIGFRTSTVRNALQHYFVVKFHCENRHTFHCECGMHHYHCGISMAWKCQKLSVLMPWK